MISADAITCHIATPNAVKLELINCTTNLMDTAKGVELFWMMVSALGAVLAAIFAGVAWRTAKKQLKDLHDTRRRDEKRAATVNFVRVIHNLRRYSQDWKYDIGEARSAAGQEQVLFRMVIGREIDREKLYLVTNVVIKAAGICHNTFNPKAVGVQPEHGRLVLELVDAMVDRLGDFDRGDLSASDLADAIYRNFETIVEPPGYRWDSTIRPVMAATGFAPFVTPGAADANIGTPKEETAWEEFKNEVVEESS
ncbi:hypothetical protein GCM10009715_43630 [Paeniglutamicibacter psychrophenolicus]|uniref:DUF4760 domain-containing protein n=1 Tax=Paeniglutamicibacter psychrophenolicus TaxID=257454 RepID=A0ABS4WDZ3_9MICC|nr:hypothetical protein [Paeniglutamicibacter psychrophenolicus]MBP2374417.1 hypothetical protein [Paeniglutamicibacter psychrophenolicus]